MKSLMKVIHIFSSDKIELCAEILILNTEEQMNRAFVMIIHQLFDFRTAYFSKTLVDEE